jgi:NitT/TauT family transport system substrate-binding protein
VSDSTTVGYSESGSSSHNVLLSFMQELRLRGLPTASGAQQATLAQVMSGKIDVGWGTPPIGLKGLPAATGTQPSTLTQVMTSQIDIGWGAPPFGLREAAEGKIRIIANGNDVPSLRTQTVRVDMVNANALKSRHDAFMRFVRAYRETLDWMFTSQEAIEIYAQEFKVAPELAAIARDKFQTREAMRNDRLSDLDAVMADAVALKFLDAPLSKEKVAELVQIPPQ